MNFKLKAIRTLFLGLLVLAAPAAPPARITYSQPPLTRQFKGKTVLFVGDVPNAATADVRNAGAD